jgi:hypothetical protein
MAPQKVLDLATVDYRPLAAKVTFKDALKASLKTNKTAIILASVVLPLFFGFIFLTVSANGHSNVALVIGIFAFVVTIVLSLVSIVMYVQGADYIKRSTFAAKNGFTYSAEEKTSLSGVFEGVGTANKLSNIIRGVYTNGNFWIADYHYETGSGEHKQTHSYSVFVAKLPKDLPNILLDSKQNNHFGLGALPARYATSQKFDLEGDFVKYFTLYVPDDYERDALYFLTPELMAILVDTCQDYDIEIVGSELRFYSSVTINFTEEVIAKILRTIEMLGREFADNTHAYKDERLTSLGVELPRQSNVLKRGYLFGLSAKMNVVIVVLFFIVWIFVFAYNFLQAK